MRRTNSVLIFKQITNVVLDSINMINYRNFIKLDCFILNDLIMVKKIYQKTIPISWNRK